jgi:hypothetical protein
MFILFPFQKFTIIFWNYEHELTCTMEGSSFIGTLMMLCIVNLRVNLGSPFKCIFNPIIGRNDHHISRFLRTKCEFKVKFEFQNVWKP